MRKLLIAFAVALAVSSAGYATKLPDNVKEAVTKDFPNTNFRFDGVIILPDNTVYLPLIPAKLNPGKELTIKTTYPSGKTLAQKPDVVIFDNDYVLLKVLVDSKGQKSIAKMANPPQEVRTGLLPQDMLVPRNLSIPENLKNIIGNLEITTSKDPGLIVPAVKTTASSGQINSLAALPQFKNKILYVASNVSKNIQVMNPERKTPAYALQQENIPIAIKGYKDSFLLVTCYGKRSMDVISLADDKVIKQIEFKTQPDEIIIDLKNNIAYVSSGEDCSIYVVNLESMTVKKQIKVNGMCEKLTLSADGTKMFYNDKQTRTIWAVELDNNYMLKEVGKFPNVSKIAYLNNKIYVTSRTKSRLAIIDYETMGLMSENAIAEKPVDMLAYKDFLYVLGAVGNKIEVIDTTTDKLVETIELNTNDGFPSKLNYIEGTNLALVTDAKAGVYTIIDLDAKKIIKTNPIDLPVSSIVVANRVRKIGK